MLLITDRFSFNAASGQLDEFNVNLRIRRIKNEDLQATVSKLYEEHKDRRSLISTKKASEQFTKELGQDCPVFQSRLFTFDDYLKVNRNNVILLGEWRKDIEDFFWFLIDMPQQA